MPFHVCRVSGAKPAGLFPIGGWYLSSRSIKLQVSAFAGVLARVRCMFCTPNLLNLVVKRFNEVTHLLKSL
jgi:hypothetical protein